MSQTVHNTLRAGLVVAVAGLAWSLGCQTGEQRTAPGALPSGLGADTDLRLNAATYFAHAHLLERQGNFAQAAQQYRLALEQQPDFASARNRLGITLNKLGEHAEASTEFQRAIEQYPTEAHLYNNLGFSLYLEGRYYGSVEALQRAIELKPEFRRAHMNHGVVLAKMKRYDDALGEFRLASDEVDAHYNLAVLQTEAGHYAEAARSLETALQLNPGFEGAREQLRVVSRLAADAERKVQERAALAEAAEEPPPSEDLTAATDEDDTAEEQPAVAMSGGEATPAVQQPDGEPTPTERTDVLPPLNAWWSTEDTLATGAEQPGAAVDATEIRMLLDDLITAARHNLHFAYEDILSELHQRLAVTRPSPFAGPPEFTAPEFGK